MFSIIIVHYLRSNPYKFEHIMCFPVRCKELFQLSKEEYCMSRYCTCGGRGRSIEGRKQSTCSPPPQKNYGTTPVRIQISPYECNFLPYLQSRGLHSPSQCRTRYCFLEPPKCGQCIARRHLEHDLCVPGEIVHSTSLKYCRTLP